MPAPVETEIKLRMPSAAGAREALIALGAQVARPRHFEDNFILDDARRSLAREGRALRLRHTDGGDVLTFKGPRLGNGEVKSREELEVAVAEAATLEAILAGLGFATCFRYQKYREIWGFESVEMMLDETPIGVFLEIEGEAAAIHATAARLGFSRSDYITESYPSLFVQLGGTGDMVFPV